MSDIPWTEVEVGNVIMVRDDELFPADLMCLYSNLAENVCFIKVGGQRSCSTERMLVTCPVQPLCLPAATAGCAAAVLSTLKLLPNYC